MGTHKIYSGIQGIRDNISGSLYGDCHELLAQLFTYFLNMFIKRQFAVDFCLLNQFDLQTLFTNQQTWYFLLNKQKRVTCSFNEQINCGY